MPPDTVTISRQEYEELIDIRDASRTRADVAAGRTEMLTGAEADAYLAAATPLAFWRRKRGLTQAVLAEQIGIAQPSLARAEAGTTQLAVGHLATAAAVLRIRMEDLMP